MFTSLLFSYRWMLYNEYGHTKTLVCYFVMPKVNPQIVGRYEGFLIVIKINVLKFKLVKNYLIRIDANGINMICVGICVHLKYKDISIICSVDSTIQPD